jgi:hypothetical protein
MRQLFVVSGVRAKLPLGNFPIINVSTPAHKQAPNKVTRAKIQNGAEVTPY